MKVHVPETLRDLEPELKYFMETMIHKLNLNRHKGNGEAPLSVLRTGLRDENNELDTAIEDESQYAVFLEAVDVANFALLIGANVLRKDKATFEDERDVS